MPCRPPRQRVLIAVTAANTTDIDATAANTGDADIAAAVPSITTDIDLSDHPLGTLSYVSTFFSFSDAVINRSTSFPQSTFFLFVA